MLAVVTAEEIAVAFTLLMAAVAEEIVLALIVLTVVTAEEIAVAFTLLMAAVADDIVFALIVLAVVTAEEIVVAFTLLMAAVADDIVFALIVLAVVTAEEIFVVLSAATRIEPDKKPIVAELIFIELIEINPVELFTDACPGLVNNNVFCEAGNATSLVTTSPVPPEPPTILLSTSTNFDCSRDQTIP